MSALTFAFAPVTVTNWAGEERFLVQHDLDLHDDPEMAEKIVEYVGARLETADADIRGKVFSELEKSIDEPLNDLRKLVEDTEAGVVKGDPETLKEIYSQLSALAESVLP